MKIALKHFLRIMLISIGIFAVVVGGQLIWYDLRFPKPPDHEQEIFSPLFQTYLAPLKLLPEQLMQSGTMAILILSLYTLILGAVVYLLISILALASNRITNRKSPEAS